MMPGREFWEFFAAGIGTAAFALLFQVPRRYYAVCGLIGGCGWMLYRMAVQICTVPVATFFAAVLAVFLARAAAAYMQCPVTVFLIAGIFPLVPGAGIYWTAYYIVMNEMQTAGKYGFQTMKTAIAIALGIMLVFELPQRFFKKRGKRA